MELSHTLADLYVMLRLVEEPDKVKHAIAAIFVCIFDNLETSGEEITPHAIERALTLELAAFSLRRSPT